jgi:polyferredoxin
MKKKELRPKSKFGLIKGFGKRLVILTLVYITFMVSMWTTLGQFFDEGLGFNWIFWVIIATSVLLFIGLVIYVERQQLKYYGEV